VLHALILAIGDHLRIDRSSKEFSMVRTCEPDLTQCFELRHQQLASYVTAVQTILLGIPQAGHQG
jgi:hypothetical protein